MEKPKVYVSPINKRLNNSQEFYYSSLKDSNISYNYDLDSIIKKINGIFKSSSHVYKSKVLIKTRNDEFTCEIVGQTKNSLLTIDGKKILIDSIIDIKKI